MAIFKNILIFIFISGFTTFLLYGSFVFGETTKTSVRALWNHDIKKSIATIVTDSKWIESLHYVPYKSGSTSSGVLSLDFGRLSTAFVMASLSPALIFSWANDIKFENLQWIVSLYDPFSLYRLYPTNHTYQIDQITNGSFYISDEPDGTVSIYSIDAVVQLSFFYENSKMTDMILFPGMYIRFDPKANLALKWADLFKIMLILWDDNSTTNTGLEFVNPRVTDGKGEDVFFMFKLPLVTKPLFQMLHVLFVDRIGQVENLASYASNRSYVSEDANSLIYNPSKKNHYLLDDLRSILSRATQSQMDATEFREKIQKIYSESKLLVEWNSVQVTLESFLTDTRFALFGKNPNAKFGDIYIETASILKITPGTGKWKFFQYLSDIYSRNIASQKRDPTFSGIDTYTPTADGLQRTIENSDIDSKDYFDVALYAYQLLKKAQDGQNFTEESLSSKATYDLIGTLFSATEKYIQWLPPSEQKLAYQTLIIQFYAPISNTITRSLYGKYSTYIDQKIFLNKNYLDGDTIIKIDPSMRENIDTSYAILDRMYERIVPLFENEEQPYAMILFRDSVRRIGWFINMIAEWSYRNYQSVPHVWVDIGGIFVPNVLSGWILEIYSPQVPKIETIDPSTLPSLVEPVVLLSPVTPELPTTDPVLSPIAIPPVTGEQQ
jgi:hypothetical protein